LQVLNQTPEWTHALPTIFVETRIDAATGRQHGCLWLSSAWCVRGL
jgi:hypothetical protein